MPLYTTKYAIPKPAGTDPVGNGDDTARSAADRLDLLLGEAGDTSITPSAVDTNTSLRVNYSRDYTSVGIPKPMVAVNESRATGTVVWVWTSAEDATGFTLNIRASTTAARSVRWHARV